MSSGIRQVRIPVTVSTVASLHPRSRNECLHLNIVTGSATGPAVTGNNIFLASCREQSDLHFYTIYWNRGARAYHRVTSLRGSVVTVPSSKPCLSFTIRNCSFIQ